MMWRVEFHYKGKEEIEALSLAMKSRLEHIVGLLQEYGPVYVREPYVKHLQDKLWEMRLKDKQGIARVVYSERHIGLLQFIRLDCDVAYAPRNDAVAPPPSVITRLRRSRGDPQSVSIP